jgi:uncharacterized protein DUF5916/cellulose/xylan binding protein with CBM9 domain
MVCLSLGLTAAVQAQSDPSTALKAGPVSYEGPAPPQPPATIARDDQGRMTIRAVPVSSPLRIDGQIDEAAYTSAEPFSDFIQMEPSGGQPATEKTDVWLFFDAHNVYVTMRAWESQPDRAVANEMRRDSNNIRMGDCVGFSLDTFYDRRNAFQFEVSPLGARTDGQSFNERQYSADWNPVWDLAVGRFNGGWTMEAAIPFKSIRYRPGRAQIWGFNARRNNKWKNEISYLTKVPPAFGIGRGSFSASLFATVVGIDAPPGSKNLEIKPYATTDLTTDRLATPRISNDPGGDFGVDAKYGITQNFTADLTYNTDFAQVEADEQQVNLTRFSLLFPEKREFFLENAGTFGFAGAGGGQQVGGAGGDTPIIFYSRRIGLNAGRAVPIDVGGRVTGRVGRWSLGLLNIQTDDEQNANALATNFSVVRLRRDILRRSNVGAIVTNRSVAQAGAGSNQAYGVDGAFQFFSNLAINTYWARTRTEGLDGDDISYRGQLEYLGDRYGLTLERLRIGDNFNPEVGFLRRDDIKRSYGQARFSPRPASIKAVRKFSWIGTITYIENGAGRLESRNTEGEFAVEFQNSDRFSAAVADQYELLTRPFAISPTVRIPVGGYDFTSGRLGYTLGQQRPFSGNLSAEYGTFYDGHLAAVGFSRTRVNLSPRFSLEPNISINWVDLPYGSFTSKLVGSRITYTVTPLMFVSALLQFNSSSNLVSSNVRLRWEYRPGSELFIVYNDERDSLTRGLPDLKNRALIVKVNRLFRF